MTALGQILFRASHIPQGTQKEVTGLVNLPKNRVALVATYKPSLELFFWSKEKTSKTTIRTDQPLGKTKNFKIFKKGGKSGKWGK